MTRRDWMGFSVALFSAAVGLLAVLAAAPFMARVRHLVPALAAFSVIATIIAIELNRHDKRAVFGLAFASAMAVSGVFWGKSTHKSHRDQVMTASAEEIEPVSRHLLIGYRDKAELAALLERFDFAGVFITARNARGKSRDELAAEIAELQAIQARHGRAPLLIATDQEGGTVARLSGPLPWRASLAAFESSEEDAAALGTATALDLQSVGVNVNFAPVVDLRLGSASISDRNSRIAERAISADPERVAAIATAYTQAMKAAGVLPVAKHFPGLGRSGADTHVSDAVIATSKRTMIESDWVPFAAIAERHASAVMVGHAISSAVDADNPASISKAVVSDVLRGELGHEGLVFSDDICMAPTYRRGVANSARAALEAGVDVVLVTYDLDVVYEILDGLAGVAVPSDESVLKHRSAAKDTHQRPVLSRS